MADFARWKEIFIAKVQRAHDRYEAHLPLALGALVGVGAGFGAVAFRKLIGALETFFFEDLGDVLSFLGDQYIILVPALGGAIVGPLIYFFAREAKGHGVPEVMLAVQTQGGRIRPRVAVVKSLASGLTIGSGGSVGREGPIVQIGSALGSTLGQVLRLPPDTTRLLVACGAAGGISATFNAPIAGVFFSLEIILRRFNMRNFSVVVLASVIAAAISQSILGDTPAFAIPPYDVENVWVETPLYAVLGVLCAVGAVVFMRVLVTCEDLFDAIPMPEYVKPILGGLVIGSLGLWYIDVLGVGYGGVSEGLTEVLLEEKVLGTMALLLVLKILATSVTIGSGGSGGVFAPSLFIGAMLGGAYGSLVNDLFPSTASLGAYATVGMAALFAGAARAPITAVIILFEMTRDYNIILPLMVAVVVSSTVANVLNRESIYTEKLSRRGIHLQEREENPIMRNLTAAQAMSRNYQAVSEELPVGELTTLFRTSGRMGLPVLGGAGELVGIVTPSDLDKLIGEDLETLTVADVATHEVITASPEQTLDEVMNRMSAQGLRQVPVVSRAASGQLLGMLTRSDIISAYSRAATASAAPAIAPRAREAVHVPEYPTFIEVDLNETSALNGKRLRDLELPEESAIVWIRRERDIVIPKGDVVLRPGDTLTLIAQPGSAEQLQAMMTAVVQPETESALNGRGWWRFGGRRIGPP